MRLLQFCSVRLKQIDLAVVVGDGGLERSRIVVERGLKIGQFRPLGLKLGVEGGKLIVVIDQGGAVLLRLLISEAKLAQHFGRHKRIKHRIDSACDDCFLGGQLSCFFVDRAGIS